MASSFRSSAELVEVFGSLLTWVQGRQDFCARLSRLNMAIKLVLHDPQAVFQIECRPQQVRWSIGEIYAPADVEVGLSADLAHRLWSGRANLLAALALREIVVIGASTRLMGLAWLLQPMRDEYARLLGRKNLLGRL